MRFYRPILFVVILLTNCVVLPAADLLKGSLPVDKAELGKDSKIAWYSAKDLTIEGQGWKTTAAPYDRLPAKAEKLVRKPVWNLSRHSAGICVRFATNAETIHAKWALTSSSLGMAHMPPTGKSGLDLYVKTENGKWRWLGVGQPKAKTNTAALVKGITPGVREYMLYLPLYNGVSSVEIGIPANKEIAPLAARKKKPIIFYGTSITQGGCASRTGMVHTAILGRRLDHPVINLGFSGNGRMEAEVAKLMTEIDASVYVIDCLPNISEKEIRERTIPLINILRKAHPNTPILLVEDRTYSNAFLYPGKQKRHQTSRAALKAAFDQLKKAGDKNLYYLEGDKLLDPEGNSTVDGSHPTDLGFTQQANAMEPILKKLVSCTLEKSPIDD